MAGDQVQANIYLRISKAQDGSTLGVERQLPPALGVCRRNGWRVTAIEEGRTVEDVVAAIRHGRRVEGIYVDNDLSAYNRSKPRKDYQRLLADIADGRAGAIAAFDIDRLTRDMREGEDIIDLARAYGTRTAFATGENYDLATPGGRYAFRGEVNRAIRESDQKSVRIKAKVAELARAGKYSGYRRPFGYNLEGVSVEVTRPDGTTRVRLVNCKLVTNAEEAEEIRAAAKTLMIGGSESQVMRDWNQRGVRRAEGGYWYTRNLRTLLLNPRIAGYRRWEGELYEAEWEPILDRETWDRVCLRIEQRYPNPHRGRRGPPPTTYLLTGGVAFCECGKRLRAKPIRDHKRGYICDPMFEGCGRHRLAEPLENFVRDVVLKAFDAPNRGGRLRRALDRTQADDTGLMALLTEERALKAKRAQLEEDDVHDRIPHEQFLRMNDQVNRRLAEIEQEKYSRPVVTGLPVEIPAGLEASRIAWQTWTIDERRAVIAFALIKVTVKAAGKGRKVFDPSHVIFDWRV